MKLRRIPAPRVSALSPRCTYAAIDTTKRKKADNMFPFKNGSNRKTRNASYKNAASMYVQSTIGGTPCYQAPEILRHSGGIGSAADVWGIGCILYEAATGKDVPDDDAMLGKVAQDSSAWPREIRRLKRDLRKGLYKMVWRLHSDW